MTMEVTMSKWKRKSLSMWKSMTECSLYRLCTWATNLPKAKARAGLRKNVGAKHACLYKKVSLPHHDILGMRGENSRSGKRGELKHMNTGCRMTVAGLGVPPQIQKV